MYSIDRLDDIWEQEFELYGGSYGKPEQVYGTIPYHNIEPRIRGSIYPISNIMEDLPDNEDPEAIKFKVNLETGEIIIDLSES